MTLERVAEDKIVELYGSAFNRLVERVNRLEGNDQKSSPQNQRLDQLFARNDKGENIKPFHIVKIGDPVMEPGMADTDVGYEFQNVFKGESTDQETKCFGISKGGIANDIGAGTKGIGELVVTGVCSAVVNVSDMNHQYAKPSDMDGILESAQEATNVKLVFAPATGEHVCKVIFVGGESPRSHAHITAPSGGISGGGSANCTVISYSDGSDVSDQPNIQVENPHSQTRCSEGDRGGIADRFVSPDGTEQWLLSEGTVEDTGGGFVDDQLQTCIFRVPPALSGVTQRGILPGETAMVEVVESAFGDPSAGDVIEVQNWTSLEVCQTGNRMGTAIQYSGGWRFYEGIPTDPDMLFFRAPPPPSGEPGGIAPRQAVECEVVVLQNGIFVDDPHPNITVFNYFEHTICDNFQSEVYRRIGLARRVRGRVQGSENYVDMWVAVDFSRRPVFLPARATLVGGQQSDGTTRATWSYDFLIIGESNTRGSLRDIDPAAAAGHKPTREPGVRYTMGSLATVVRIQDEYFVWDINEEQMSEECDNDA